MGNCLNTSKVIDNELEDDAEFHRFKTELQGVNMEIDSLFEQSLELAETGDHENFESQLQNLLQKTQTLKQRVLVLNDSIQNFETETSQEIVPRTILI